MTEQKENNLSPAPAPKKKPLKRWLHRLGLALTLLFGIYIAFRIIYPFWIESQLPDDAPRIAFSLDNSLLGQIGVTNATYQRVMTTAGGRLIALRPDMGGDSVEVGEVVEILEEKKIEGVLLTGGGDVDPEVYGGEPGKTMLLHRLRDDFEMALIRAARERGLPILGICRGCQIINVAFGGTVRNLRKDDELKKLHLVLSGHEVELVPESTLAKTLGTKHLEKVVSLHGQAVEELGEGIRIAGKGPGGVIEAIEGDSGEGVGWIVGVQWHPEMRIEDPVQHKVFEVLVERAREVRERREKGE